MVFGKRLNENGATVAGGDNLNGSYKNDAYVVDAASMREIDLGGGGDDDTTTAEKSVVVVNMVDTKRVSFDDALDIIGFGRMQIVVLLVCGTIIMTVLTETMGMGLIMTAAHCDMQLDATRKGILSSVTFIGILLSSQVWGFLADTRGRRRVILYTLLGANACTVISSFATDFIMLVLLRFLAGVLMSAASSVTYAYLGEFNSLRNRSTVIACACIFAGAAYVYIPLMGFLILPGNWSLYISDNLLYRPWRLLVIVNTVPGFLAALCLIKLPESGKFLLTQGLDDAALDVLRRIYRMNTGRPADTFTIHHLLPEQSTAHSSEKPTKDQSTIGGCARQFWQQTVPLFQQPLRLHFLICCFLVFGVFFVSAGIGLWYPEIQNQIARSNSTIDRTVCDVLQGSMRHRAMRERETAECTDTVLDSTFADTGILGGFYVLVYVVYALCIRRLGVGPFLVAFLFLSGFAGLSLQWIAQPTAVVVLFSSHIVLAGVCISLLTCIVVVLIPTEYRGMAVSISMMFGRVGSIVGSNLVAVMLESNCSATFYLYSGFILVCGLTSLALPIRKL